MAALTIEGWEAQSITKPGWIIESGNTAFSAGRFGGSCIQSSSSNAVLIYTVNNPALITLGYAFKIASAAGWTSDVLISFGDINAYKHFALRPNSSGYIEAYRGTGNNTNIFNAATLVATASVPLGVNVWDFIEVQFSLHDTTGVCIVRLNGVEVMNFSGDTRNNASSLLNEIRRVGISIGYSTGNQRGFMDDFYIHDGTGSVHNGFRGDFKIEGRAVNGNGASSQLVGSDGNSTDNYLLLDDVPASMTDYVGSSTVGQRDLYTVEDLVTTSGTVLDVQVDALVQKADAGPASVNLIERLNSGTERETGSGPLSASATWVTTGPKALDPEGVAWTVASVNAMQIGAEVS